MNKPLLLFFLLGLAIAAPAARADDDQICFAGPAKKLEASVSACTAVLGRPLLTPEWKLRALKARGHYHALEHRFDLALQDFTAAPPRSPLIRQTRWRA